MAFCKFSSQLYFDNKVSLDNAFLNEFLPYASGECIKVYLYGLYKCYDSASSDNTLESFSKILNISQENIIDAFKFWQEQGIIQIVNIEPIEIKYLPVKNNLKNLKKFNKDKYSNFNIAIQNIIEGRMLTPNEFAEYYTLIECYHIEPEALLMIAKYCTLNKGTNVGWSYITTVAKNWANEGILTTSQIEEKLNILSRTSGDVLEVLHALKLKRTANLDEFQMFLKWQKDFGFSKDTIIFVAKKIKIKANFNTLDKKLFKYYESKLFSIQEIDSFEQNKEKLFSLAKEITRTIGVFYENLDTVVENYILHWFEMGYDEETLKMLANYCFKNNQRTLQGMDNTLLKFHKLGLISTDSINQYIDDLSITTTNIKEMLSALGLHRSVISNDYTFYKIFTQQWNFNTEIILYACELSKDKQMPMQYLNKILSTWNKQGITNLEQAVKCTENISAKKINSNAKGRSYSEEEIKNLFTNLDEVEI